MQNSVLFGVSASDLQYVARDVVDATFGKFIITAQTYSSPSPLKPYQSGVPYGGATLTSF
jgi:hypothetical protein